MSSGDHNHFDDAPGSLPKLRVILLKFPDVGAALRLWRRIDRRWAIPYLAGISADARTVYVDKHLPERIEGIPLDKYLEVHEATEYALYRVARKSADLCKILGNMGLTTANSLYERCHHLATAAEQYSLISDGYDWKVYRKGLEPYFTPIEHEKIKKCPPDLALYPYKGKEREALEKAQKRSRLDKDEANYLDFAPTARRCELCEYFLPYTRRCVMVKGEISFAGSCDKFMPKGAG